MENPIYQNEILAALQLMEPSEQQEVLDFVQYLKTKRLKKSAARHDSLENFMSDMQKRTTNQSKETLDAQIEAERASWD